VGGGSGGTSPFKLVPEQAFHLARSVPSHHFDNPTSARVEIDSNMTADCASSLARPEKEQSSSQGVSHAGSGPATVPRDERRMVMRKAPLGFLLLLFVVFALPAAAEDCRSVCISYEPCGAYCDRCVVFALEGGCAESEPGYCGELSAECGQCAILYTWETDEEISRHSVGGYFCGIEDLWYGGTNESVFLQYQKLMHHVTYGHQVCNGVESTVVVSSYYFNDTCYQFIYPDCCAPSDPGCYAPYWEGNGYQEFNHSMECH
jgi:hypothetical protein